MSYCHQSGQHASSGLTDFDKHTLMFSSKVSLKVCVCTTVKAAAFSESKYLCQKSEKSGLHQPKPSVIEGRSCRRGMACEGAQLLRKWSFSVDSSRETMARNTALCNVNVLGRSFPSWSAYQRLSASPLSPRPRLGFQLEILAQPRKQT